MTKIFIFGLSGKMGKILCENAFKYSCEITGGFDRVKHPSLPTFDNIENVNVPFDVIIDFSRPETLPCVIDLSAKYGAPVVLATTGYDAKCLQQIEVLSQKVPVFQSANLSLGINVIGKLVAEAVRLLGETFDVEIIEKHHNQKVDAPSGTANMLARAVAESMRENPTFVYGREGADCKRKQGDVGIHAVRGGTVVGEHEVSFYGNDEVITVSHSAQSRAVFATGALRAAAFLANQKPGKYNMEDLLRA